MRVQIQLLSAAAWTLLLTSSPVWAAEVSAKGEQTERKEKKLAPEEQQKQRDALLRFADESLEKLYAIKPEAKRRIEEAPGYAVFDVSAVNVILFLGQRGKGVMIDNRTQKPTFMRATRAGTGPGLGYREIRQIFVFKNAGAMEQFKLGNAVGGDVSAAVSVGKESGQISFNPNIDIYQITDKGLAVEAQWGGTAYLVDPDLN
jgi:lipid-binding SYLF domain-containing protein